MNRNGLEVGHCAFYIVHSHCDESIFRSMMTTVMCVECVYACIHTPSVRSTEWAAEGGGDLSSSLFPSRCPPLAA